MRRLLLIVLLTLTGCVTVPTPPSNDPAVYRPTHRVTYPTP